MNIPSGSVITGDEEGTECASCFAKSDGERTITIAGGFRITFLVCDTCHRNGDATDYIRAFFAEHLPEVDAYAIR